MNGVQLDSTALGLTLPESPPAAQNESRRQPSFDDHLQQARRQDDRSALSGGPDSREQRAPQQSEDSSNPSPVAEHSPAEEPPPAEETTDGSTASDLPALRGEEPAISNEPDNEEALASRSAESANHQAASAVIVVPQGNLINDVIVKLQNAVPVEPAPLESAELLASDEAANKSPLSLRSDAKKTRQSTGVEILPRPAKALSEPAASDKKVNGEAEELPDASTKDPAVPASFAEQSEDAVPRAPMSDARGDDQDIAKTTSRGMPAPPVVSATPSANVVSPVLNTELGEPQASQGSSPAESTASPDREQVDAVSPRTATIAQPVATANEATGAKGPPFLLPGRNTPRTSGLPQLSDAERTRLVQRVARAMEAAGEGGQIRLRLSPPELGSLRMDVSVRQGVLTAHVEAETPQARMLLLDNLPVLRERLQEQNVKIERFDVDLMNQSPGGQPHSYRQREQDSARETGVQAGKRHVPADTATEARPAIARSLEGGEQLNVVI